jgi:hypothetical protein
MVPIRIPRFSSLLYQTTGDSSPVPVRIPFTIKKGISNRLYTPKILSSHTTLKTNLSISKKIPVEIKAEAG